MRLPADWRDRIKLPTPHLNKIFGDQGWDTDTQSWFWAQVGHLRTPYTRGNSINQQPMYLWGAPSTGKSQVQQVIQAMLSQDRVATFDPNVTSDFKYQALLDTDLVVMPEVDQKSCLSRKQLLEFANVDEPRDIQIKHRPHVRLDPAPKPFMVGNHFNPVWAMHQEGELERRMPIFPFRVEVPLQDRYDVAAAVTRTSGNELACAILKAVATFRQFDQHHARGT